MHVERARGVPGPLAEAPDPQAGERVPLGLLNQHVSACLQKRRTRCFAGLLVLPWFLRHSLIITYVRYVAHVCYLHDKRSLYTGSSQGREVRVVIGSAAITLPGSCHRPAARAARRITPDLEEEGR